MRDSAPDVRVGDGPAAGGPSSRRLRAVLFDRDGTLVHDVPYNGDPALVRPVEGARGASSGCGRRACSSAWSPISRASPVAC